MLPKNLAFVDIETTGLNATHDRIIEIGILRVENDELAKTYQTLINPETYFPPQIEGFTGITKDLLERAPVFYEVKDKIAELLSDCLFVAHNARFDYGFIKNEFKRYGQSFSSKQLCTVKLSRYLFPQQPRHNLDDVINRFNIDCPNRHRAYDDAKVLWQFYQKIQKQFSIDTLKSAISYVMKKPSLPANIKSEVLDRLPESSGIYIFYGDNSTPLYVGKSISIKDRVLSHFSSDHSSPKEMKISQQIKRIETVKTSGELGALVTESMLIKQLQPMYNRMLRLKRDLTVLKTTVDDGGYNSVDLRTADEISVDELKDILGVFRSQQQAKTFLIALVKEFSLCEKLLNLEKTKSACFAYRLGICKGACIRKEISLSYNMRFAQAFTKHRIKPWPFDGAVLIKEHDEFEETSETFVVDKWCLLGSVKSNNLDDIEEVKNNYSFDVDTYKILLRYIFQPRHEINIKPISRQNLGNIFNVI